MEEGLSDTVPCSALAVDSVLRTSTAGVVWGCCFGPFEAKRLVPLNFCAAVYIDDKYPLGLSGSARTLFITKTIGECGFSCGLFGAIFSFTHCGIQRYRGKKDWLNTFGAAVVTGAAFGAGTRKWGQVAGITCLFSTIFHLARDS